MHLLSIHTISARIHFSPPASLAYVMWGREAGPRSREGRSLCGQTGQSHPEGWVLRQQKRKNPPFFIVKDAVECDGLISDGPGRGISERKGRTKVI